jgi:glycopeptide antibiotics resistance protein
MKEARGFRPSQPIAVRHLRDRRPATLNEVPRNFPTSFVTVAALCFLSSTDWVGGIRVEIQNWAFNLIGDTGNPGSIAQTVIPKLPHLALFGLLGYLAAHELRGGLRWWLFAASIAVAVAAELLQNLTSTREFTVGDLAINVASVIMLFSVAVVVRHRFQQTSNP